MSNHSLFVQLSKDAQQLADIALACQQSSSFFEDMSWYRALHRELQTALDVSHRAVDEVLDFLQQKGEMVAYERFLSMIETASIYTQIRHGDQLYDGMSMAIPVSAWSRFAVPQPSISAQDVQMLTEALSRIVLTENARVYVHPYWMRSTQVDTSFVRVRQNTAQLVGAALDPAKAKDIECLMPSRTNDSHLNADSLVLLLGVAVPAGQEMFRWQRGPVPFCMRRDDIMHAWQRQIRSFIDQQFPACHVEVMLPEAFYAAMSAADKQIQVGILSWHLQNLVDRTPGLKIADVVATVMMCCYSGQYEVRIGLSRSAQQDQADEGVLWYLQGPEQGIEYEMVDLAQGSPLMTVAAVLERLGVVQVNVCRRVARVFDWDEDDQLEYPNPAGRLRPLGDSDDNGVNIRYH